MERMRMQSLNGAKQVEQFDKKTTWQKKVAIDNTSSTFSHLGIQRTK